MYYASQVICQRRQKKKTHTEFVIMYTRVIIIYVLIKTIRAWVRQDRDREKKKKKKTKRSS